MIAIGVPMVVQVFSMFEDLVGSFDMISEDSFYEVVKEIQMSRVGGLVVTPKEVDFIVDVCAGIIAKAINTALFG